MKIFSEIIFLKYIPWNPWECPCKHIGKEIKEGLHVIATTQIYVEFYYKWEGTYYNHSWPYNLRTIYFR